MLQLYLWDNFDVITPPFSNTNDKFMNDLQQTNCNLN
jgi:uncharacterized protein Usg